MMVEIACADSGLAAAAQTRAPGPTPYVAVVRNALQTYPASPAASRLSSSAYIGPWKVCLIISQMPSFGCRSPGIEARSNSRARTKASITRAAMAVSSGAGGLGVRSRTAYGYPAGIWWWTMSGKVPRAGAGPEPGLMRATPSRPRRTRPRTTLVKNRSARSITPSRRKTIPFPRRSWPSCADAGARPMGAAVSRLRRAQRTFPTLRYTSRQWPIRTTSTRRTAFSTV
jgi:hypothetical protein